MPRYPGILSVKGSAAFGAASEGRGPSEVLAAMGAMPEEDLDHGCAAKRKDGGEFQPLQTQLCTADGKQDARKCQTKPKGEHSEEMLHGSDDLGGLFELVDQGVLLLDFQENGDLLL